MNAQTGKWGNPARPDEYPRRILLAVTGESPQVVTETLYALAVTGVSGADIAEKDLPFGDKKTALAALAKTRKSPPFMPTDVLLITTSEGAKKAEVLHDKLKELTKFYGLEAIPEEKIKIKVITRDERKLDDIRSISDNKAVADFITQCLRDLTSDPSTAIHASVAGGRKTMGALLANLMMIYGRPQDRLTHVLVSGPVDVEECPKFYFPHLYKPAVPIPKVSPDGKQKGDVFTYKFRVELAELPLLLFRHFEDEPGKLIPENKGLGDIVGFLREPLGPVQLAMDPKERQLICGDGDKKVKVRLAPLEYSLYELCAYAAKQGKSIDLNEFYNNLHHLRKYLEILATQDESQIPDFVSDCEKDGWATGSCKKFMKHLGDHYYWVKVSNADGFLSAKPAGEEAKKEYREDWVEEMRTCISKINKKLKNELRYASTPYMIVAERGYRDTVYRISLNPDSII